MKKILIMVSMVAIFAGLLHAQETKLNVAGEYTGQVYTIVKDSVEKKSEPVGGMAKLSDNGDGTYNLVLTNVAAEGLTFNDIALDKIKLAENGTSASLQRDPEVVELTTNDGKVFNGVLAIDTKSSVAEGDNLSATVMYKLNDDTNLYIFFSGARPAQAQPEAPAQLEVPADVIEATPESPVS